jgi:hypothetical protein
MKTRDWLLPTGTGIAGVFVGFFLARHPSTQDAAAGTSPAAAHPSDSAPAANRPTEILIDDLRRVVREELAARDSARPAASVGAPALPEPPTPEQTTAAVRANTTLDAAIARRTWTDADAAALREGFYSLTPDNQDELLRKFSVAVNTGRLVPETDKIPF